MLEIIAHRGASGEAPENTLASVRLGWQQAADAVEIDVRLTRDGRIAAFHDATTDRCAGQPGRLADLTFDELRRLDVGRWKHKRYTNERVPMLREVLETIPAGGRLYVEIKCGPELTPALQDDLASIDRAAERVVLISLSIETLREVKQHLPTIPAYPVVPLERTPEDIITPSVDELIALATEAGFEGMDLGHTEHLDETMMQPLTAAGLRVCVWTVNDATEAARLRDIGVAGITTDWPARLRAELEG